MNFFSFHSKLLRSSLQVHAKNLSRFRDREDLSQQHRLIMGEFDRITFPVLFEYDSGRDLFDILECGWPSLLLISAKLKAILEANNFSGWKTYSVEVFSKNNEKIEGYYGFSVIGRSGPIDYSLSSIFEKKLIESGPSGKFYKGQYFNTDTWDGNDFFLPKSYFGIIVTERVATILSMEKISNLALTNL